MEEDSIIFSQSPKKRKGLRLSRQTLKEKPPLSQSLTKDLGVLEEDEEEEDSVVLLSQKEKREKNKRQSLLLKRHQVHKNISTSPKSLFSSLSSPPVPLDDSIASQTPKKALLQKRGKKVSGVPEESPLLDSPILSTKSGVFDPNFESTRILTPSLRLAFRNKSPFSRTKRLLDDEESILNLSSRSRYQKKLTNKEVMEGGTQMTPVVMEVQTKETEADLSIRSVYKQMLKSQFVVEGGTQTTPIQTQQREDPSPSHDACEPEATEDVLNEDNSLDGSVQSGFIACKSNEKNVLVPISEEDFEPCVAELADSPPSKSPPKASPTRKVPMQNGSASALKTSTSHADQVGDLGVSPSASDRWNSRASKAVSSLTLRTPEEAVVDSQSSLLNEEPPNEPCETEPVQDENANPTPEKASTHCVPPLFCPSDSESEEEDHIEGGTTRGGTLPDRTMSRITPKTFKRRYGSKKDGEECGLNETEDHSRRKILRKSIYVKRSRAQRPDAMMESPVCFKEGFEYFSRFCPFTLKKDAKAAFNKVSQEIISDIMERLTDEAFYNSGRTNVSLQDVKNVMLQYKCFPLMSKTSRFPNQHLYNFLIKNCDAKAAKQLIPMTSFDVKKDRQSCDIWAEPLEESPKQTRKRTRVKRK